MRLHFPLRGIDTAQGALYKYFPSTKTSTSECVTSGTNCPTTAVTFGHIRVKTDKEIGPPINLGLGNLSVELWVRRNSRHKLCTWLLVLLHGFGPIPSTLVGQDSTVPSTKMSTSECVTWQTNCTLLLSLLAKSTLKKEEEIGLLYWPWTSRGSTLSGKLRGDKNNHINFAHHSSFRCAALTQPRFHYTNPSILLKCEHRGASHPTLTAQLPPSLFTKSA